MHNHVLDPSDELNLEMGLVEKGMTDAMAVVDADIKMIECELAPYMNRGDAFWKEAEYASQMKKYTLLAEDALLGDIS